LSVKGTSYGDSKAEYEFKNNEGKVVKKTPSIIPLQLESVAFYEALDLIKPFANNFQELVEKLNREKEYFEKQFVT
jgi:hypothetical protein